MAKVYVYVEAVINADGPEAKKALTPALKKKLLKSAIKEISAGVPKKLYSAKADKKPSTKGVYNAIKVQATIKLKITTKGSNLRVDAKISMIFEALKWPKTKGSLLGSAKKGGGVENAGSGPKLIEGASGDLFYAIAPPMLKKIMTSEKFIKMAGNLKLKIGDK
ncbi:MAG: hypothetical protein O7G85_15330 [Planctomycetota bacterium]|nr:hypothetical protein [Planctomycetota bacterium]